MIRVKKQNTRNQILHSGKRLYEENNMLNIKVSDIAKDAKVARATFFTHFKNLEELYLAIGEEELKHIFEYYHAKGGETKEEKILSMVETIIDEALFAKKLFHKVIFQNHESNAPIHKISEEMDNFTSREKWNWIFGGVYSGLYIQNLTSKKEILNNIKKLMSKI